ncbi:MULTISPECIES: DUF4194 domain-containing protein [Methylomonas]|uniref:DUF4194 domain-containing protein n=1 Tax=Methylomonas rapida TaxID=2963939 RepID=A0ABY7GI66_9GAMM|nr:MULTISPECIES: DUF4194 domain-containing protein [Methylomonas]WAR44947.1 DUF4194 domain-containing protein [Methylomonas rapida]
MSHDDLEHSALQSGISDLFDRFRQRQDDHPSSLQNSNGDIQALKSVSAYEESFSATPIEDQDDSPTEETLDDTVTLNNGSMPPEARRALVSLFRQGVILASQKSNLFDSICRYQDAIRNHLADVYLKLILDQRAGVAFIAGLDESDGENEETVSLITRRTLSLYDTFLLLVLRKHYQERETTGEQKIIIDVEKIEANLSPFLSLTNSSKSDRRQLDAALKKMTERHILSSVRGNDDRFEITPIIRYVVNAEFLESMLLEYQQLAREAGLNTDLQEKNEIDQGEEDA